MIVLFILFLLCVLSNSIEWPATAIVSLKELLTGALLIGTLSAYMGYVLGRTRADRSEGK